MSVETASKQAQASFRGDENVLKPDCGKGGVTINLLKSLNYLNQVNYMSVSYL